MIKLNDPTGESTGPLGTDSKTRIRQNQNIVTYSNSIFFSFTSLRFVLKELQVIIHEIDALFLQLNQNVIVIVI